MGRDEEGAGARGIHSGKSHIVLVSVTTDDFNRRTTAIGAQLHPKSLGAIAGRTT